MSYGQGDCTSGSAPASGQGSVAAGDAGHRPTRALRPRQELQLKSISFHWTPDVEGWEAETVVSTVAHLQEVMFVLGQRAGLSLVRGPLRPFGTWVIPSLPRGSPYWSILWYVQESLDEQTGQLYGPRFLEMVRDEPWQQAGPHYDVAIVHADLLDEPVRNLVGEDRPYVFSSVSPDLGAIVSVHRLRAIDDTDDRRQALRCLAINAFGHVLDLPGRERSENVATVDGMRSCTNQCALRHAPDIPTLVDLAREEHARRTIFCEQCTDNLLDQIVATHFARN